MPTVPTPHDHAYSVETLAEKEARLTAGQPIVTTTRYEVSLIPEGDINRNAFLITVEYRGGGKWAVLHCGFCLNAGGGWDYESIPSERADDWLIDHRFPLDEAFLRAKAEAPHVTVNGHTAAEAYQARSSRTP